MHIFTDLAPNLFPLLVLFFLHMFLFWEQEVEEMSSMLAEGKNAEGKNSELQQLEKLQHAK